MDAPAFDADVLILCGGLGTRLGAVAGDLPKPMADVWGRPFLQILVDYVHAQGASRIVLCAGFRAGIIRNHFEGQPCLVISEETIPLGTGGALRQAEPLCLTEDFLLLNGDSFCVGLDLRAMLEFHRNRGGLGTIAGVAANGRDDVGTMTVGPDSRVLSFVEKSSRSPKESLVNAGVYAFDRRLFALIGPGHRSLESEVLPAALSEGFYSFSTSGPLWDIGTPERLMAFRSSRSSRES